MVVGNLDRKQRGNRIEEGEEIGVYEDEEARVYRVFQKGIQKNKGMQKTKNKIIFLFLNANFGWIQLFQGPFPYKRLQNKVAFI